MKYNIIAIIAVLLIAVYQRIVKFFHREDCHNALADSPHPTGNITLIAEFAPATTHLLVKKGAAAGGFALCAATDKPLGPCTDTPASAEKANVRHLGASPGTFVGRGSKAIAAQVEVYTTAAGKITDTAVNNSWLVGTSVTACSGDGAEFIYVPCYPVKQTV
jgi:hypothetical protein